MAAPEGGLALHLLRHADAGDPARWSGPDALRPLSGKGRRQAERLARQLVAAGLEADAVISSPLVRAMQTAEIVGAALGLPVIVDDRLAAPLGPGEAAAILHDAGDVTRPILVGHDPDFSDLAALLTGATELPMRKGAMARIDFEEGVREGRGILRWLLPPELLPG